MANTAKAFQHENGVLFQVGSLNSAPAQYMVNQFGGIKLNTVQPTEGLTELPWDGSLALLMQQAIEGSATHPNMGSWELNLLAALVVEKIEDMD